ncbi:hypothetical protein OIDMADRAFT_194509 [Oidiodendron maius Zn]|jgi:hypothetical protein|uniref:Yeast cell wall synthesis Kre9/Knh1-like N-terminal domain-containing protein n=1 Tax=Oidiodendron maius (strain Zn) TaxID=913774 RepID=A0A0C3H7M3_OIDMZ|nr:hypothetical protein OIDMADRAFT_194509 [Oidiodendron maius Zn]
MKFSVIALLAAASSVVAQTPGFDAITAPAQGQVLKGGSSFKFEWQPNKVAGTVTLTLIQGAAFNLLNKGPVLATGVHNLDGAWTWNPVANGQYAAYGLNISLDSDPSTYQLSNGFHISGSASTTQTSQVHTKTTTLTLAPGPSYSALMNTSTAVYSQHNVTSTPSYNTTVAKPTTTAYPTTSLPAETTASGPTSTSAPTQSSSPIPGAAAHMATSGLAMFGGLLLAFAL